jgi:hypothetical protein
LLAAEGPRCAAAGQLASTPPKMIAIIIFLHRALPSMRTAAQGLGIIWEEEAVHEAASMLMPLRRRSAWSADLALDCECLPRRRPTTVVAVQVEGSRVLALAGH